MAIVCALAQGIPLTDNFVKLVSWYDNVSSQHYPHA
jgi:hypothetical protein